MRLITTTIIKALFLLFFINTNVIVAQNELDLTKLTESQYAKLLHNQFSQTLTGQSNNSLGNFASVNIIDSEVEFAPSIFFSNGNILTTEFKAGVTDGISSVFRNSKLNSNIEAKINYHFLFKKNNSISIRDLKSTKKLEKNIEEQRDKEISSIDNGDRVKSIENEILALELEHSKNLEAVKSEKHSKLKIESYELKKIIAEELIKKKLKEINSLGESEDLINRKNSLRDEINKKKLEIIDLNNKIFKEKQSSIRISQLNYQNKTITKKIDSLNKIKNEFDSRHEKILIYDKYRKKTEELISKYKVIGIEMIWFSAFYKVGSNSFKRINSELEFDNQIINEDFVSHGFGSQLSWLKLDSSQSFNSFFWSNGFNFSYSNNFNDLNKQEITEITQLSTTSGERAITKKFNAYSGNFLEHNRSLDFYSDFYYFLFHKNQAAIHLNPTYQIIEDIKPRFNFNLGVVFSFKNSKKEDNPTIVNAEVFYNFLDLFKTTETDYKLFERNNIGLRFTFPINFNIK